MVYDKDKHIEELQTINSALTSKLSEMTKRKMERNNEATLKWRNKYFYVKKQLDELIAMTKQHQ